MVGNATKHGSVDVPCFRGVRGINITRNIQVVTIAADFLFGNQTSKFFNTLGTSGNRIHNSLDVGRHELIRFAHLAKTLGSVNKQDVRFLALLAQHQNNRWNTCSKENVCR